MVRTAVLISAFQPTESKPFTQLLTSVALHIMESLLPAKLWLHISDRVSLSQAYSGDLGIV